jgi:hypothetical protein
MWYNFVPLQTLMSAKKEELTDVTIHKSVRISLDHIAVSVILVINPKQLVNAV